MTPTATATKPRTERKSEGRAPCLDDAALGHKASRLSVGQSSGSINNAIGVGLGSGVEVVPVAGSVALERAHVHDVRFDGQRIGGICYARGAWRVLSFTQATFASRAEAVEALLTRRGRVT